VPDTGESTAIDGHVLTVLELDGRRISRVKVEATGDEPAPAGPALNGATATPSDGDHRAGVSGNERSASVETHT
jgi:hypothetical protein